MQKATKCYPAQIFVGLAILLYILAILILYYKEDKKPSLMAIVIQLIIICLAGILITGLCVYNITLAFTLSAILLFVVFLCFGTLIHNLN